MNMPLNEPEPLDLTEHGAKGASSDRRLFMQLQAFTGCGDSAAAVEAMRMANISGAVYEDVADPYGIAVVTYSEEPTYFVDEVRLLYRGEPFKRLELRPELTMFGRSYSIGYEADLDDVLVERPKRTLLNPDWPWGVWYPVRRKGAFQNLPMDEQRAILMEHGTIGMRFGRSDAAHDIRLACHGLDRNDNDFIVGLVSGELAPLSKLVETMRKTKQTSQWIQSLGPFFVGRKVWQSGE